LAALLEAEGFHASSVLISSVYKLDTEVPSPGQFNHAITMVPLAKEEVWMDTTTEVAPSDCAFQMAQPDEVRSVN
jgi:hypothetical protein